MPIFHDLYDPPSGQSVPCQSPTNEPPTVDRPGDGLGEPFLDSLPSRNAMDSSSRFETEPSAFGGRKSPVLTRIELIERIKRGNSPSWRPFPNNGGRSEATPDSRPTSRDRPKTPLMSPSKIKTSRTTTPDPFRDHTLSGLEIERPRSALHSGDFREKKDQDVKVDNGSASSSGLLATSPVAPWHHSFPAAALPQYRGEPSSPIRETDSFQARPIIRPRASSQASFPSPFAFIPPTSPLVQQSNNTDLDFSSRPGSRQSSRSPERSNRRHTFSPQSFRTFASSQVAGTPAARHLKREGTFPYQAHQPRRSLTSINQFQPHSTPQTPVLGSRRPSFSSESPLHHAPMVGSYEESILRGRMSTTPSRPLDFVAQIGVLGKGLCKPNLRCPPHVTVPFPAVFYSYGSGNGRAADNSPSPYVGLVDLENSLASPEENGESRRKRRHTVPNPSQDELDLRPGPNEDPRASKEDIRRKEKRKRRSTSPRAPPGGSYRIPQQGQLQIVIKNPNKTAVKLFLVPYDLSDMEPGQKTFVRQRSYSAGPIIDMPLSSRKNLGTDRPEAALSNSDDPNDRPILRYLIHLHICCPSKGRFYLYKSIRVVFANRVPDGKEKLRNETQLPEPRYSTYKPTRDSLAQQSTPTAAAHLTAEKASRRRSLGVSLSQHQVHDRMDGLSRHPICPPPAVQFSGGDTSSNHFSLPMSAIEPIPFSLAQNQDLNSRSTSRGTMDLDPASPHRYRGHESSSPPHQGSRANTTTEKFEKLSRSDIGYGGNAFREAGASAASPGPGLLAQRLRGLDVQPDDHREEDFL